MFQLCGGIQGHMELRSSVSNSGKIHVNESTEFSCDSSFDLMNVHALSAGSYINHDRRTSGWDGSTLLLPVNPSDQWCPGQTSEVNGVQLRHPYAQPIPLYKPSQVTAQVQTEDYAKSQKVTVTPEQGLSTPSNYSPITWVPPPSTPTPPSSHIVASSLKLLQHIIATSTASKLQVSALDTRGSRVFTATDSVFNSDAACLHTSTVQLYTSTPGSTRRGARLIQQKPGKMPCVHEETGMMVENLADVGREKTLVKDWPRDIPRPYMVFPCKTVYVDGTTRASSVDNNIIKETKTSEAISKKNYFLRRNDKDADVVTSRTMETLHKATQSNGDNARSKNSQRDIVRRCPSEKKGVKKKSDVASDKGGGKKRKDSSERSRSDRNRTPPPITRTPHPKAPMIPGTPLIAPRPLLPSTLKAIPLRAKPLDSRPLSPITHLTNTVLSSDSRHIAIRPRTENLHPSSTSFLISSSSTDNVVTDVPIRPVPIAGSLRPCLNSSQPRYLPVPTVHFPPRSMLPIPIPQLAAFTGSPLTFIHPGIHIFPGTRNQPYPTLTNLPHVGLPTVPVPFFKRTHPFPILNNGAPDSLALRQRYCEAIAPPSRRQSRRRRQSSGDSQPAEDGPETQKVRRKEANARERDRVNHLNSGFEHLRTVLPWLHHGRRVSKVDTLRSAIDYINHLQRILWESDATSYITAARPVGPPLSTTDMCKFVHHHHYPRFGMLPTTFTFAESATRTAVDPVTCRGLELRQPPAKIPRFNAPQAYPPHSNYWFNNLTLHGGVPVPFTNGPTSESTSHAPTNDVTKMSDINNNVTNAVGR